MKPAAKKTAARKTAPPPAAPELAKFAQSPEATGCPHTRVKPLNEPDAAGNTEQCAACSMRRVGPDGEWRAQL
jgi:hypothetical protein